MQWRIFLRLRKQAWRNAADLVVEPEVSGFGYDDFKRAAELIAVGESAMRKALPEVKKWLEVPAEITWPTTERRGAPRTVPMPAD